MNIRMKFALLFVSAFIAEGSIVPRIFSQLHGARSDQFSLVFDKVVAYSDSSTHLYSVTFHYDSGQSVPIFLVGVGTVRASGRFRYLTSEEALEFRESSSGAVLTTVPIRETLVTMGNLKPPEIPKDSDFPTESKDGKWVGQVSFAEHANDVLNHEFPFGCKPILADDRRGFVTSYRSLENLPRNILGEAAVMVLYPDSKPVPGRSVQFHLKFRVLESRVHSKEWLPPETAEVQTRAADFATQLMAKLEEAR